MIFRRESAKLLVPVGAVLFFAGAIDAAQAFPFGNPEGAQLPGLSVSAAYSKPLDQRIASE
jgi:hypothetical protein